MTAISQDVKDLVDAAKRRALADFLGSIDEELVKTLKSIDQRLERIEREIEVNRTYPVYPAPVFPDMDRPWWQRGPTCGTTDVKASFGLQSAKVGDRYKSLLDGREFVFNAYHWIEVE